MNAHKRKELMANNTRTAVHHWGNPRENRQAKDFALAVAKRNAATLVR